MSNYILPMPEDIGHVLQTITDDGTMHLALCHPDGSAWNPELGERFPHHVLTWLQSHAYAGGKFGANKIVWIDYVAPDWADQLTWLID